MAVVWCILLPGCAAQPTVFIDADPEASVERYKTFRWLGNTPILVSQGEALNPVEAKRVQALIEEAFVRRGYRYRSAPDSVDFLLSFTVGTRDQIAVQVREYLDYRGPHWRWGDAYYGINRAELSTVVEEQVVHYTEGTLAIDVYDVARREPVWHARSQKVLTPQELRDGSAPGVESAISAMVAGFPQRAEATESTQRSP